MKLNRVICLSISNIILSDEAKILVMSGTHGTDSDDGVSALTDIDESHHGFYQEDCLKVGIKAGPEMNKETPPLSLREPLTEEDWRKLPDLTKPAEKITPPPPGSLGNDDLMKKMDIRVAHITYYYKNKEKLIRDIRKVGLNQMKTVFQNIPSV